MKNHSKISRRKFFRRIGVVLLFPLIYLVNVVIEKQLKKNSRNKKIIIPKNIPEGMSIVESVVINKSKNEVKIFSAKCTHLGCLINEIENNELVCPCHGSRFNSNGVPIKGPATKQLEELKIIKDSRTGEYFVNA